MRTRSAVFAPLVFLLAAQARGDLVEYRVPGTNLAILLQGKATVNAGKTVTFRHRVGNLYFSLDNVDIHQAPSAQVLAERRIGRAVNQRDAAAVMQAARWALHLGMLDEFYEAVDKALEIDSEHAEALLVKRLKQLIDTPLVLSPEEEQQLRKLVRNPKMKVATSAHFLMLHDTPDSSGSGRRNKPRAQARLELLEQVYESFLLKFYSQGIELEIPPERMKVVLFNEHRDYLQFATGMSAELASTAGFYDPIPNVSFFYDQGTDEGGRALQNLAKSMESIKEDAIRLKDADLVRLANTLSLLVEVSRENSDIEVVSHEATHQLASNTGLLPRYVRIPTWVHEGLATYFESPAEAAWSGIGAVNDDRLRMYRALERDREHSNLDFIVGDQIFNYAASHGATLHGYGQAWALTHFLMERHFEKFMTFYRRLGEAPPYTVLNPDVINKMFDEVFGGDRSALDAEWRAYMRSLKTDVEEFLEDR